MFSMFHVNKTNTYAFTADPRCYTKVKRHIVATSNSMDKPSVFVKCIQNPSSIIQMLYFANDIYMHIDI